jgi:hypothetical protein
VRDVSNNLKLYRGEILRHMHIEQDGFAANAETGLRPLLEGRDVKEVPIAWINRSSDMGVSTFRVARVAPGYVTALARMLSGPRHRSAPPETVATSDAAGARSNGDDGRRARAAAARPGHSA